MRGVSVILVRLETSADDMEAIRLSAGVLTARGGMTSHAALVARGLGRVCVTGCAELLIDERRGRFRVRNGDLVVNAGETLTIDGGTGEVILGTVATAQADVPPALNTLLGWCRSYPGLRVHGLSESVSSLASAINSGCDEIGLCYTESMFFEEDSLGLMREMVLAYDAPTRRRAFEKILPILKADFLDALQAVRVGCRI